MYRNSYATQSNFAPSHTQQSQYRYTSTTGFGQRAPLYPIGPTLTQPQFRPMQRGVSPSPYLNREGMKPPSYENKYLPRAESLAGQINLSYEQRQRRLIQKNQREIQEQQKRRQQIRISYERQIKTLTSKLNRNIQKKQKLHTQIENLQKTHENLNQKLLQLRPPEKTTDNLEHIDRKQQQMIILKNKLMNSMRENQIELNKKYQQEQKYWEEQLAQKQKYLFQAEQNLREKRLQLYLQKQKSLQKPDLINIQQQIRNNKFTQFVEQYEQIERRIKYLTQQRENTNKKLRDNIELKRPQFHNNNVKRQQIKRDFINLQLRVKELERVSAEMDAANQNLQKQLQRKQSMITKYQQDIHELKQKKQHTQSQIHSLLEEARSRDSAKLSKQLSAFITKINDKIKVEQARGARLKNGYQRLYELLCSAASKNIHQVFTDSVIS